MAPEAAEKKIVCVTGASFFIGSWLVMKLLQLGYTVRAVVRDLKNEGKVKHLVELPNAKAQLTLWKADLGEEGSFDEVINGCVGVFHVATPMDFHSKDPENEVIKPTIDGVLSIMKACENAKTVKRLVYTSSAGAVSMRSDKLSVYDENCWADVQFCRNVKMTGWVYFVSKTLAEKAAWDYAKKSNIEFISIIPTLVVGPFLMPSMPASLVTALAPITGNEAHYSILKQCYFVHLDDLCDAHIFLYEHPEAQGRYICSSHDATILELAKMLRQKFPQYHIPTKFKDVDEDLETLSFSSEKLKGLGFKYKYSFEDMYEGAIKTCQEKGLLPQSTTAP